MSARKSICIVAAVGLMLSCCKSSKQECPKCPEPVCPQPTCPEPVCPKPECPEPAHPPAAIPMDVPGGGNVPQAGVPHAAGTGSDRRLKGLSQDQLERECKKLYEEAYILKETSPKDSTEKLEAILRVLPQSDVYYAKALGLLKRIRGPETGGDASPEPALPTPVPGTRPQPDRAKAAYMEGYRIFQEGNYKGAIARFKEAITLDPSFCPAYVSLGATWAKWGNADHAAKAYQEFVHRCPDDPKVPIVKRFLQDFQDMKTQTY